MAFQTGSATDLPDLLSKLNTFAVANGWTLDEFDTVGGDWALSKNDVYVSGRWDVSTPLHLSLHQALAFDGTGTLPGDHTDDSGHGFNASSSHANSSLDDQRHVSNIGDGPFTSYFFFENDASPAYIHIAVQSEPNVYKHFGFGEAIKVGTWTGGEYCYGYYQDTSTNQTATASDSVALWDAISAQNPLNIGKRNATIHVEGLAGMGPSDKWGYIGGNTTSAMGTDSNGNPITRCVGGFRGGPIARHWGHYQANNLTGFLPLYPIKCWHYEDGNDRVRPLAILPDVRGVHMRNFAAEQEIVIGADTWVLIPSGRLTSDNIAHRTFHQGIAYKKVTA